MDKNEHVAIREQRRYPDLSLTVRAFLENLSDQDVVHLTEAMTLYEELSTARDGKITPLERKGLRDKALTVQANAGDVLNLLDRAS